MIDQTRPDLSSAHPAVRTYVEALEAELARLRAGAAPEAGPGAASGFEPSESPSGWQIITASAGGLAKRSPRHLYDRQRRGGMGIFDLDTPVDDPPRALAAADVGQSLIFITNHARAFYWPVSGLPVLPVRARGQAMASVLGLQAGERLSVILPAGLGAAIALLSQQGFVRVLPGHIVNQNMVPGTNLYRADAYGALAAACWTSGAGDLFVASRAGQAIRFPEKSLPLAGGVGLRLKSGDSAVAIQAVRPPDGQAIFLLGADGRGTVRLMSGFAANKAPGGGGKLSLKTSQLVGAVAVAPTDDVFVISRLSKIIRFRADEVPAKEGVVHGVDCMSLRGDEVMALTACAARPPVAPEAE